MFNYKKFRNASGFSREVLNLNLMIPQINYMYLVVVKTVEGVALNDLEEMWLQVDDKSVHKRCTTRDVQLHLIFNGKLVINNGMCCCSYIKGCNKINMMVIK